MLHYMLLSLKSCRYIIYAIFFVFVKKDKKKNATLYCFVLKICRYIIEITFAVKRMQGYLKKCYAVLFCCYITENILFKKATQYSLILKVDGIW